MFRHSTGIALVTCMAASAALLAQGATGQGTAGQGTVKQHGRAIVQYRSPDVSAVASYEYSQKNHAGPWLLIELAIMAKNRIAIERDQISLRTPDERTVRLAAHTEYLGDRESLTRLYQNASIFRRPLEGYFPSRPLKRTIRFFAGPGTTISDSVATNLDEVATGDLLFVAPQGKWPEGDYALVLNHPKAQAELPIKLQ
jgi:hypothetical protein